MQIYKHLPCHPHLTHSFIAISTLSLVCGGSTALLFGITYDTRGARFGGPRAQHCGQLDTEDLSKACHAELVTRKMSMQQTCVTRVSGAKSGGVPREPVAQSSIKQMILDIRHLTLDTTRLLRPRCTATTQSQCFFGCMASCFNYHVVGKMFPNAGNLCIAPFSDAMLPLGTTEQELFLEEHLFPRNRLDCCAESFNEGDVFWVGQFMRFVRHCKLSLLPVG